MNTIIVIQGNRWLRTYLKNFSICKSGKCKYISCEDIDTKTAQLLQGKGFEKITSVKTDENYREKFISEYINLIGRINKENNTKKWLATDIVSKDQFKSKLVYLLQQFLAIADVAKEKDFKYLIVFNPSWVIVPSLENLVRDMDDKMICLGNRVKKWTHLMFFCSRRVAGIFFHMARVYWRSCCARKELAEIVRSNLINNSPYYVIKTFIYDNSFKEDNSYRDAFFGILPEFLKSRKKVLIYPCIIGNYRKCVKKIKKCSEYVIIPVEFFLSLADIVNAAKEVLFGKMKIRKDILFFGYKVKEIINNELLNTFKGIQYYQFLYYWCTRNLLKTIRIEKFLIPYGNKPWEKMCSMAIRAESLDTKIIGYQHTVVPQSSACMFISHYENKDTGLPDVILTVGEATKRIMQKYGNYRDGMIRTSCGLRFEYLSRTLVCERKNSRNILVACEGIFEVYKLINYVMKELKDNTNYTVTIRPHPVLPIKYIRHKLRYNLKNIPNFRLSHGASLKEDIEWADIIIYWGSTVALEALSMGKALIRFDMDSILSNDPLFECNNFKWVVSDRDPLIPKIEEIYALSNEEFSSRRDMARAYLQSYFCPVSEDSLNEFVN